MLSPRSRRAAVRGLSIVELMVGVAIGLMLVGAAMQLSGRNIASSRVMLSEVRVNQDLRALGDLVTRDLRRAGYWGNAILGTQTTSTGSTATVNPYATVTASSDTIGYAFTRDTTEDNALGTSEQFGFRLVDGKVEMQSSSGTWQAVTDPAALTMTVFTITPVATVLPLGHLCPTTCAPGAPNCPTVTVRRYDLVMRGQSVRDSTVVRELRSSVRVRNDQFGGACPA